MEKLQHNSPLEKAILTGGNIFQIILTGNNYGDNAHKVIHLFPNDATKDERITRAICVDNHEVQDYCQANLIDIPLENKWLMDTTNDLYQNLSPCVTLSLTFFAESISQSK